MNNNKYTPTKSFYYLVGLIITVLISTNFYFILQNNALKKQQPSDIKITQVAKEKKKDDSKKMTEEATEQNDSTVTDFVHTLFNYTNDNYLKRFDSLESFATADVVQKVKQGYLLETPETKVKSEVTSLELFHAEGSMSGTTDVLVIVKSSYKIEDVTVPMEQIFKVTVHENEKETQIVGFEIVNNSAGGNNIK